MSEIAGLPKATVHRILQKLCRHGLLIRQKEYYYVGPTLLRWMNATHLHSGYIDIIHPRLLSLSEKTGHTIHLIQREGNYAYYIDKIDSKGAISANSRIGDKLNLYSTAGGRAILALFTDKEVDNYFKEIPIKSLTSHTLTDIGTLRREIDSCRKLGFALEIEQNETNIQCIGAPFRYHNIDLAISITLTTLNSKEELIALKDDLLQEIKAVKELLGN